MAPKRLYVTSVLITTAKL